MKWSREKVLELAKTCTTKKEFNTHIGAKKAAIRYGCLNDINEFLKPSKLPNGYWDFEKCSIEALKYNYRIDFKNNSQSAYRGAIKLGILDEICSHMTPHFLSEDIYTFEYCLEKAIRYTTKKDFNKFEMMSSIMSKRKGFYEEICNHMVSGRKKVYYTFEECMEVAKKYNKINDFKTNDNSIYCFAERNGFLNDITKHIIPTEKPKGYWLNKENCLNEALKYTCRADFHKYSGGAYQTAKKNGFFEEICSHMEIKGNLEKRKIYSFEFPINENGERYVYVGLTCNINKRLTNHNAYGSVYEHSIKTNTKPIFKVLSDFLSGKEAQKMEGEILDSYINDGWIPINRGKTGGLGSAKVNWEERLKLVKNMNISKKEFKLKYKNLHNCLMLKGLINEAFPNDVRINYLKDDCINYIKDNNINNQTNLKFKNRKMYNACRREKWLDEFFPKH